MAKFYTLGPVRVEEYAAVVAGLRHLADTSTSRSERSAARSALRHLDPRLEDSELSRLRGFTSGPDRATMP